MLWMGDQDVEQTEDHLRGGERSVVIKAQAFF